MRTVAAFDFDGTLTIRDTLIEFIKHSKGSVKLYATFLLYSPLLILYKLGLYPNWKIKEKIFSRLFRGMKHEKFKELGESFYQKKGMKLMRPKAIEAIKKHLGKGDEAVIITASIYDWVEPFAKSLGIENILATTIEIDKDGSITGKFKSANCYGKEKVNRLLELFPERHSYRLEAYGDSNGDKELLNFAEEPHYRVF